MPLHKELSVNGRMCSIVLESRIPIFDNLMFLLAYHGISWTFRQLKYFINKKLGLRRRRVQSPIADVRRAIALELRGSGRLLGHRSMTRRLQRKYGLTVGRNVVREA